MLNTETNNLTRVSAYDILGVSPNAPQRDIHAALRKLALAWHPDRVPSWRRGEATLRFQSIMDAYNKIRTPDNRRIYDDALYGLRAPVKRATAVQTESIKKESVNDNIPFATKAKAWFKALETVFWPVRK